jgi:hypothetical protein
MKNKKKSHAKIVIADDTHIEASVEGVVPLFVLNTTKNPDVGLGTAVDVPGMVVPKLGQDLIAVTHFFEEMGYSVHLRPKGHCEFYRFDANGEKETIAIRWDAVEKGFFMDVVTSQNPDKHPLAAAHVMDLLEQRSTERVRARNAATLSEQTLDQAIMVLQDLRGVTGIVTNDLAMKAQLQQARVAKHDDPLNCRLDLKGANGGMTREKAAKLFAHIGCVDPMCWVCRMVRGDKPYKLKVPAEMRVRVEMPNFRLTLDFVQWSCRSAQGNNYTANAKDVTSTMHYGIHVVFKDDIYDGFAEFIRTMRADDRFNWMSCPFCSEILADRDGTWGANGARWKLAIGPLNIRMRLSDPADKNSNSLPELANKEMERRTKSLLCAKNLPPHAWEDCYQQGAWLKARLPQGGNSFDVSDNPRPLEVATNFRISRKQITKELSAHIPIGTPALTWNAEVNKGTAKGSDIHTRARWGIAKSMDRHVPQFFDPFTKATFHTGSCVAMHLEEGINWWQFLGMQGPTPPRAVFVPIHPDYKIMIMLPELADRGRVERMAVKGVSNKAPTASAFIQMLDPAGRIFEPGKEGDFEDAGRTVYDPQNKNEPEGALGTLTSENLLGNGWNQCPDHTKDPNFQKMLLINRPRDFVNQLFTKKTVRGTHHFVQ